MRTFIRNYKGTDVYIDIFLPYPSTSTYFIMIIIHNGNMFIKSYVYEDAAIYYLNNKFYEHTLDNFYKNRNY